MMPELTRDAIMFAFGRTIRSRCYTVSERIKTALDFGLSSYGALAAETRRQKRLASPRQIGSETKDRENRGA